MSDNKAEISKKKAEPDNTIEQVENQEQATDAKKSGNG